MVSSHFSNLRNNNMYIKIGFSSLSWKDIIDSASTNVSGNLLRTHVLYTSACVNGGFRAQLTGVLTLLWQESLRNDLQIAL